MDIHFPAEYQQELSNKLGVDPEEILDVINKPDKVDLPTIDDLSLMFFLKRVPQMPQPYYLLVYGQFVEGEFRVHMAWKIYPSLDDRVANLQPVELLEVFAQKFGMPVSLGPVQRRFFFDETVQMPGENWRESIAVENPEGHEYVQQIFTKADEVNDEIHLKCALGLCIDIDRYRTWMANQ